MSFLIPLVACLIIGWMESDGGGGEGRGRGSNVDERREMLSCPFGFLLINQLISP
jgi:hypothetical protein